LLSSSPTRTFPPIIIARVVPGSCAGPIAERHQIDCGGSSPTIAVSRSSLYGMPPWKLRSVPNTMLM
jgi:hypothetical protein